MRIQVRFFASLADAAGVRGLELEIPEHSTVKELWDVLAGRYPKLAPHLPSILRAVNEEFRSADTVVHDGDEVAFFPSVSGG